MPPISPEETPIPPARPQPTKFAALVPLKLPVFRMLWSTWLVANICMWMNDVAAAWMMTTLTSSPIWVALVQSASTLPGCCRRPSAACCRRWATTRSRC